MAGSENRKEYAVSLLRRKRELLDAAGERRLPRRSDFSDGEVCLIKAFLGPWPRALEAAGLKDPPAACRAEKNRERRAAARRRRNLELKNLKKRPEEPGRA